MSNSILSIQLLESCIAIDNIEKHLEGEKDISRGIRKRLKELIHEKIKRHPNLKIIGFKDRIRITEINGTLTRRELNTIIRIIGFSDYNIIHSPKNISFEFYNDKEEEKP